MKRIALPIAARRTPRSLEVNAPSLNAGCPNKFVVAIPTPRPVASNAVLRARPRIPIRLLRGTSAAPRATRDAHVAEPRIAVACGPRHPRLHHISRTDHFWTNPQAGVLALAVPAVAVNTVPAAVSPARQMPPSNVRQSAPPPHACQ